MEWRDEDGHHTFTAEERVDRPSVDESRKVFAPLLEVFEGASLVIQRATLSEALAALHLERKRDEQHPHPLRAEASQEKEPPSAMTIRHASVLKPNAPGSFRVGDTLFEIAFTIPDSRQRPSTSRVPELKKESFAAMPSLAGQASDT